MTNEAANPRVVDTPTGSPSCSQASGIIVWASIASLERAGRRDTEHSANSAPNVHRSGEVAPGTGERHLADRLLTATESAFGVAFPPPPNGLC